MGRFRGGLGFKALRLLYKSTPVSRGFKKKKTQQARPPRRRARGPTGYQPHQQSQQVINPNDSPNRLSVPPIVPTGFEPHGCAQQRLFCLHSRPERCTTKSPQKYSLVAVGPRKVEHDSVKLDSEAFEKKICQNQSIALNQHIDPFVEMILVQISTTRHLTVVAWWKARLR